MNIEDKITYMDEVVKFYERLVSNEPNLKRKAILIKNKIELEKCLLKFWEEKIAKDWE